MPINPGIALGVQPAQPLDMLGAYGKAMSIKSLVDGARLQEQQGAALSQKMQFDAQDQALDLAKKKVGIYQQSAAGLMALPPEQRAAQYPMFRAEAIRLTGDANIPEQYDEAHVARWAASGMDPKATYEAIQAERQRIALSGVLGQARGEVPSQGLSGEVTDAVATDGSQGLKLPQVNVADYSGYINNPSYHFRVADLVNRNPMLAGTKAGAEAIETALKLQQDRRQAEEQEWKGYSEVAGADGKTYLRRGPTLVNAGDPLNVGQKAPDGFTYGPDGKLTPIPEYWAQKRDVAKAGAANVNVGMDAYEKAINKGDAEAVVKAREGAEQAASAASDARAIAEILKGQNSGKWTEMQAALGGWLPGTPYANVTSIVSLAESIRARAAPALRVPGSGAMSDFETKQLLGIFPQLLQSDAGRELTARVLERVAERQAIAADIKDEMVRGGTYSVKGFNKRIRAEFGEGLLLPEEKATLKQLQGSKAPTQGSKDAPITIRGDDGYNALPSGALFKGPDGVTRRKP